MRTSPAVLSIRRSITPQRVFVTCIALVLLWIVWALRATLIPYVVGLLVARLLTPLVGILDRHLPAKRLKSSTRRRIAALVVYVAAVLVFVTFFIPLVRRILNRVADMILGLPGDWSRAISENPTIHAWYVETVPADVRAQIEASLAAASVDAATWLERNITLAINTATGLIDAIVTVVAIALFVFYVMVGDERVSTGIQHWLSPTWRAHLLRVEEIAHTTITSYARALLTEASIVGSLTGIGLFLVGVDSALPLAIVGGVFNLIPYIGYWLALILSVVVVAGTQPDKLVLAVAVYLLVQSADNWYFAPHFQGGSTGWTPAQTLVIMACGSAVLGPIGLVITLPLAAFARETIRYTYDQLAGPSPRELDLDSTTSDVLRR